MMITPGGILCFITFLCIGGWVYRYFLKNISYQNGLLFSLIGYIGERAICFFLCPETETSPFSKLSNFSLAELLFAVPIVLCIMSAVSLLTIKFFIRFASKNLKLYNYSAKQLFRPTFVNILISLIVCLILKSHTMKNEWTRVGPITLHNVGKGQAQTERIMIR